MAPSIQEVQLEDLPSVATVHLASFPDSSLTKLGHEAVRRYYEWQLTGPHDVVALGFFADSELAGFCLGGVFRGALSGFLRKNRWFLAGRVLMKPNLLRLPIFRARISLSLRIIKPKKQAKKPPLPKEKTHNSFGILSIAVHPKFHGHKVGKILMENAENIARLRGFTTMHLTVHLDNQQALGFYEHLGWQRVIGMSGTWTGSMRKQIEAESMELDSNT